MDILRWFILIVFVFLSVIPVIMLNQYKEVSKYRALRHLMQAIFSWSVILLLLHLAENLTISYYLQLAIYPTVFVVVYFAHETVQSFLNKKTPKYLQVLFLLLYLLILIVSFTNPLHLAMIKVDIDTLQDIDELIYSEIGWFFYIHLAIAYTIIISFVVRLLKYLRKPSQTDIDLIPFYMVLASVVVGLSMNVIHMFVYSFYIDPTYLSVVLFGFTLYYIIYKRDFHLNLLIHGRKEIINSMREMMVIADHNGRILEYSKSIDQFFHYQKLPEKLSEFMSLLNQNAILYTHFDEVKNHAYTAEKPFLYTIEKPLIIPSYKKQGKLILLYDESMLVKLVDNLNYLRTFDQMTELYNRNHFEEHRGEYETHCHHAGVIILDLNGLKLLNDYYGHEKGDEWIIRLANRLKEEQKSDDVLAIRLGGDEFLLFFKSIKDYDLKVIAQGIDASLTDDDIEEHVSISYGIAERKKNEPLDKVLSRADKALYSMKEKRSPSYQEKVIKYHEKSA